MTCYSGHATAKVKPVGSKHGRTTVMYVETGGRSKEGRPDCRRGSGNNPLLLQILDRRLPLLEEALPEILERGLVRLDLEQYSGALEDLEFFVQNSQDAKVKKLIEERLPQVRLLARSN